MSPKWYKFDDGEVSECKMDDDEVLVASLFVLLSLCLKDTVQHFLFFTSDKKRPESYSMLIDILVFRHT